MAHPPILARSLPEANLEVAALGPAHAVVSIGEPGGPLPYGFDPRSPFNLRLEFHDIVEPCEGFTPPGLEHIEALLRAALVMRTARQVYCHCMAGISRSTAVAYILRCHWGGPGCEREALEAVFIDRPQAAPNPRLVELADVYMERQGAMIEALRQREGGAGSAW